MVWKLDNADLQTNSVINNNTVTGLELTELGNTEVKAPLFRFQPLGTYNISRRGSNSANNPGIGITPILNTFELEPVKTLYLYSIDYFWDILNYNKVTSINNLASNTYAHFNNKTYLLLEESVISVNLTTSFFSYVPQPDSTFVYELNIAGFNIETVTQVNVEGLVFNSSGSLTFTYDNTSGILLLNGNNICQPQPNELVEIVSNRTLTLSTQIRNKVFEFDISSLNIDEVLYLEYKGKNYTESSNLLSGSLFNNYENNTVYTIF